MQKTLFTTILIATVSLVACADSTVDETEISAQALPAYTVVSDVPQRNIKRTVDVQLTGPVNEDELRVIAEKIKALDSGKYQRTFISYMLPGMEDGYGFYATTNYNPSLEVKILMLSKEDTAALSNVADTIDGEIIGQWFDDTVAISSKKVLVIKDGTYQIYSFYKDGSGSPKDLSSSAAPGGMRLDYSNDHGEFLFLSNSGDLSVRSSTGFDFKYRKAEE